MTVPSRAADGGAAPRAAGAAADGLLRARQGLLTTALDALDLSDAAGLGGTDEERTIDNLDAFLGALKIPEFKPPERATAPEPSHKAYFEKALARANKHKGTGVPDGYSTWKSSEIGKNQIKEYNDHNKHAAAIRRACRIKSLKIPHTKNNSISAHSAQNYQLSRA